MTTAPIKVALVGAGRMGANHHRVILANPRFELVAVADPISPLATHRSLAGVHFDAAVVVTPTATHFDVASKTLGRGLPLLVEKPLASTYEQCQQLCKLGGELLSVGHVERFNPAVQSLSTVLAAGRIGTPIHFSVTRVGGYPAAVTPGNDVLLDLAVHDLDILRSLLGPLSVVASVCHATVRPDVCDTAEILLRAQCGASATVCTNWISPVKIRTIRVTGTGGVIFVDLIAQTVEIAIGNERTLIAVPRAEPLADQLNSFANLIDGKPSGQLCSGADAAAAVLLAEQALRIGGASGAVLAA